MYCNSTSITPAGLRRVIGRYIKYGIGIWFSPNSNENEIIRFCECIECSRCGANYLLMNMNENNVTSLIHSLNPQRSALQNYKDLFNETDFENWKKKIIAVVKIESNTLHIFFKIKTKKAYLVCNMIQGHFTIISVEEVLKWKKN